MKLAINEQEVEFMNYVINERRDQVRAITPIWTRHKRTEAKRVIDNLPYQKGLLIPYIKKEGSMHILIWDSETHYDLTADIRDHLAEQESSQEPAYPLGTVHELLRKIEMLSAQVEEELKKE